MEVIEIIQEAVNLLSMSAPNPLCLQMEGVTEDQYYKRLHALYKTLGVFQNEEEE